MPDSYMSGLEPRSEQLYLRMCSADRASSIANTSAAISLKRIADILERIYGLPSTPNK